MTHVLGINFLSLQTGILAIQKLFFNFLSYAHNSSIVQAIAHETGRCCKYYQNDKNLFQYVHIGIKYFSKAVQ